MNKTTKRLFWMIVPLLLAGVVVYVVSSTTNTATDAVNLSVATPQETSLNVENQATCELTADGGETQEGWTIYLDNKSCVKFEMPSDWDVYQGDGSVAISAPAKESSNLDTYELFSIKQLDPSSKIYQLNTRGELNDGWTAVDENTFMLGSPNPDASSFDYVHYADDGRIYKYSFQDLTEKDALVMSRILDTLVIK